MDLKDIVSASCENKDVGAVGETPNVEILAKTLRVSHAGRVRVRLRCPRGVKSLGCKGTLRLSCRAASAQGARQVYQIRAGRAKTVILQLSAGDVRNVCAAAQRRGVLTSVEKGRKGPQDHHPQPAG